MSNTLAISAVTRTLRQVIDDALKEDVPLTTPADVKPTSQTFVTTLPPDKARDKDPNANQINLFLYLTCLDPIWRNQDLPRQAKPGDNTAPPLALKLHYLITAYAEDNNDLISQFLLGRAMRALHDSALLMPAQISDALSASELHDQVERVRLTPQPMTLEDMSKLWMMFQTQYRISAAYEVSVVLIDSRQTKRVALPVRAANIYMSTFRRPRLATITPQVIAPGGKLTIEGENLDIDNLKVRFGGLPLQAPDSARPLRLEVTAPAGLRAGVNTVQAVQELPLGTPPTPHPGAGFQSNVSAIVVTPRITTAAPINAARETVLTLAVDPPVGRDQRVQLLIGDRPIPQEAHDVTDPDTSANVSFFIPADVPVGAALLRVQVDGADSPLDVDTNPASPTFNQYVGPKVTIV